MLPFRHSRKLTPKRLARDGPGVIPTTPPPPPPLSPTPSVHRGDTPYLCLAKGAGKMSSSGSSFAGLRVDRELRPISVFSALMSSECPLVLKLYFFLLHFLAAPCFVGGSVGAIWLRAMLADRLLISPRSGGRLPRIAFRRCESIMRSHAAPSSKPRVLRQGFVFSSLRLFILFL